MKLNSAIFTPVVPNEQEVPKQVPEVEEDELQKVAKQDEPFDNEEVLLPPHQTDEGSATPQATERSQDKPKLQRPDNFEQLPAKRSLAGRLIEHGEAPYMNDPQESMSYYVVYEHNGEKKTIWGKDLKNAIEEKGVKLGDHIKLDFLGSQPVSVLCWIKDDNGKRLRQEWQEQRLNLWRTTKVDADFCQKFVPFEAKKSSPHADGTATTSQSTSAQVNNFSASPKNRSPDKVSPIPGSPAMPAPARANANGSILGNAIGKLLTGIHNTGSAAMSGLTGQKEREQIQLRQIERHEQLLNSVNHSAARASTTAREIASGALAPVLHKMEQRGVSLGDVLNTDKHPDLKKAYGDVMTSPTGQTLKNQIDELNWYVQQAAQSGKDLGVNVQPQLDDALDGLKNDTKNMAVPDKKGGWEMLSDAIEEMIQRVHEIIRQIFEQLTPKGRQNA